MTMMNVISFFYCWFNVSLFGVHMLFSFVLYCYSDVTNDIIINMATSFYSQWQIVIFFICIIFKIMLKIVEYVRSTFQ